MGSPYNKMISAKFYVETWVGRLDTFFRQKIFFAPFFDTKDIFLTRTGTGTGPKQGGRYKAADHTGGGPYTSPGKERIPQTVQNTSKKHIFPPFSTQKIFF